MDAGLCCVEACQASDALVVVPLPQIGNAPTRSALPLRC
jgi:hypothetical protein